MTCKSQSECFISSQHSFDTWKYVYNIDSWPLMLDEQSLSNGSILFFLGSSRLGWEVIQNNWNSAKIIYL